MLRAPAVDDQDDISDRYTVQIARVSTAVKVTNETISLPLARSCTTVILHSGVVTKATFTKLAQTSLESSQFWVVCANVTAA
jgi:hypothetical protein